MVSPLFVQAQALHQRSQFQEAEQAYRHLLAAEPGNFAAWHWLAILYFQQQRAADALMAAEAALKIAPQAADSLMLKGVLLQAAGRREEARDAIRSAANLKPDNAESWYNLGLVESELKNPAEAVAAFDRALALQPTPQAWHNRGLALQQMAQHGEALESFDRALALAPSALPALYGRAEALLELGRNQDAMAAFDQLLAQDPSLVDVWNNKGMALWRLKCFADALASYDKAVALAPGRSQLWISRFAILFAMNRHDEALASLDKALAIEPGNDDAQLARGQALCEAGKIEQALAFFAARGRRINGGRDVCAADDVPHKQRHDQEQRAYLAGLGITHGKYHLAEGARVAGHAVNPNAATETDWQQSDPKLVVMDDFLSAEALEELRRYCWGSTVWQRAYADGYLGAMPNSGFGCPLLAQIAEELQSRFPAIFAGHGLCHYWGFKYDSSLSGINIHADQAAVNVNFWITPDEANLDPAHGGLVVWDVMAPLDWSADQYNGDVPAARKFLAEVGAKPQTVPYRANRAVIFDSDLFHETDVLAFKPGYLNRRINITMLFGRRIAPGT
jgi:tetratricopeptide (TPR) repeat protein